MYLLASAYLSKIVKLVRYFFFLTYADTSLLKLFLQLELLSLADPKPYLVTALQQLGWVKDNQQNSHWQASKFI